MRLKVVVGGVVAIALLASTGVSGAVQAAGALKGGAPSKVALRKTSLGRVLVGPNGRTLYLHLGDHGATSTCNGDCLVAWPAFRSRLVPRVGRGVKRRLLRVYHKTHHDQIAYAGHLLYYFESDTAPGQVRGEGVAGFYAVSASGRAVISPY